MLEAVDMVSTENVMNTLFKAQSSIVELFAETLIDATTMDSKNVDGAQLDKVFSFAMLLTYCDKCREPHWFIGFAEHGTPLERAVPEGEMIELVPVLGFEEAIKQYQDINDANKTGRH